MVIAGLLFFFVIPGGLTITTVLAAIEAAKKERIKKAKRARMEHESTPAMAAFRELRKAQAEIRYEQLLEKLAKN